MLQLPSHKTGVVAPRLKGATPLFITCLGSLSLVPLNVLTKISCPPEAFEPSVKSPAVTIISLERPATYRADPSH